jgi:MSHA biogenesis protein MshJ
MSQWQVLSERFSRLQQREKLMLWGGSLLLTLWLALIYLLQPTWQSIDKAQSQLQVLQRQNKEMQQQAQQLQQQLIVDIDSELRSRISILQQQQQQLNNQIRQGTSNFIGAEQMVSLLQNMLQSSSAVQVTSLHTSAPQPVRLQGQHDDDGTMLFQHKLTLEMSGDYTKLYQVLQRIEQLPWLVSWTSLQYKVTTYPTAQLTLELGTVSENEDFIRL